MKNSLDILNKGKSLVRGIHAREVKAVKKCRGQGTPVLTFAYHHIILAI